MVPLSLARKGQSILVFCLCDCDTGGYARNDFKTDTVLDKDCKLFVTSAEDAGVAAL